MESDTQNVWPIETNSDENMVIQCDVGTLASNQSKKSVKSGDGSVCKSQSLGLLSPREGSNDSDLNVDEILTLLQGNRGNLNYFLGLWSAMKVKLMDVTNDSGETVLPNCDPRDEGKRRNIKDWRPGRKICPVGRGFGNRSSEVSGGEGDCAADGDALAESYVVKQTVLDGSNVDDYDFTTATDAITIGHVDEGGVIKSFPCGAFGCGQVLTSLANYEAHYHQCHNYVCDACRRVFVSNFLLDIHLEENHDSYFDVLRHRIDMFRCLVESCEQKFRNPELRKDHLVTAHKFPSNFSFHQPVKANCNRSKYTQNTSRFAKADELPPSMEMECEMNNELGGAMMDVGDKNSAGQSRQKKKIPATVCFGRGSQKAFQQRRGRRGGKKGSNWFQQTSSHGADGATSPTADTAVDIESVDMKELADALT